jgi:hypothetical protein
MKVDVYWNLHKQTFSIRSREKEDYGRVIRHADHVHIKNPTAVVSKAGRERVLREKKKNVHAVIRGELVEAGEQKYFIANECPWDKRYEWQYNPYMHDQFMCRQTEHGWPIVENVADYEWTDAHLHTRPNGRPIVKGFRK